MELRFITLDLIYLQVFSILYLTFHIQSSSISVQAINLYYISMWKLETSVADLRGNAWIITNDVANEFCNEYTFWALLLIAFYESFVSVFDIINGKCGNGMGFRSNYFLHEFS